VKGTSILIHTQAVLISKLFPPILEEGGCGSKIWFRLLPSRSTFIYPGLVDAAGFAERVFIVIRIELPQLHTSSLAPPPLHQSPGLPGYLTSSFLPGL
jgi:hypothetical protein